MRHSRVPGIVVSILVAAVPAGAANLRGGGSIHTDCVLTFEVPGANKPALPKTPKMVDCIDGDTSCDADGLRNGQCVFELQACLNSTAYPECTPTAASLSTVDHAVDDGQDDEFDTDFQALQTRIDGLGFPHMGTDDCTLDSAITVKLVGPDTKSMMKKARKNLRVSTSGTTTDGDVFDVDKVKFTCRPEGDRVYHPVDLYSGTFDRIRKQVFAQSCAVSACHDSEGNQAELILLPGAAYGNIVNVTPHTTAAANDGLKRITPGDPNMSLLYRKITGNLPPTVYGEPMPLDRDPLDPALIEIIRLWILGDGGMLGPAPEFGWVAGTDQ